MNSHHMINITPGHANKLFSDEEFDLLGIGAAEVVSWNKNLRPKKGDEVKWWKYLI